MKQKEKKYKIKFYGLKANNVARHTLVHTPKIKRHKQIPKRRFEKRETRINI